MPERWEEAKGRAKEAAGDLTDNADLKRDGQADRGSARAKAKVDEAVDSAHKILDDARTKGKGFMDRVRERRERGRS